MRRPQAIDYHVFRRVYAKTLTLAFPGMACGAAMMACVVKLFYPVWGWDLCLLLGTITSATDPVAVVALLRELGAKVSLSTTIEGESLLNDGAAVVIFSVGHTPPRRTRYPAGSCHVRARRTHAHPISLRAVRTACVCGGIPSILGRCSWRSPKG